MNNGTNIILTQRAVTHGRFEENADISQSLKSIMRESVGCKRLNDVQREALDMLMHKIGRILAGDPSHADHWADIAGYAELVVRDIVRRREGGDLPF